MSKVLAAFAAANDRCWLCQSPGDWRGLQVHHVARGCHRGKAREELCCLIRTCAGCHENLLDSMPVSRQLALVLIHNPLGYSRVRVNELRGRAPDSISEQDVAVEVARLWRDRR